MTDRKRLSDILHGATGRDQLALAWNRTEAAGDFNPIPSGNYDCRIVNGEPFTSRSNSTPGYKLTFRVLEGEHTGRQVFHELWLTPAALPMTKRDLAKLGVTSPDQLDRPLPPRIRCRVRVTLRTADDGSTFNAVKGFEVLGIDPPDPFAPTTADAVAPPPRKPPTTTATGSWEPGDAAEPVGTADTSFDPSTFEG